MKTKLNKYLQISHLIYIKTEILLKNYLQINFFYILQNHSHIFPTLLFINVTYYVQNECEAKFNRFSLLFFCFR